tara:strand:+ start:59 stop:214 length:156 start_codon:yes stop_codon:yes gene_type:complete
MVKKYRVTGTWSRQYLAKDETEANKYAQHEIGMRNIVNIDMNVNRVEEVKS